MGKKEEDMKVGMYSEGTAGAFVCETSTLNTIHVM